MPVVTERTNIVYVTNANTGAVWGYMAREPVATNLVAMAVTNFVPVFFTNVVQVPVTNLIAKPEAITTWHSWATGCRILPFSLGLERTPQAARPHLPRSRRAIRLSRSSGNSTALM